MSGLLIGRIDSPLTTLGQRQAVSLGQALAAVLAPPCLLVTSPLRRAVETAEEIAAALTEPMGDRPEVRVDDRFVELDYGELDGMAPSELAPGLWDRWRSEPGWRPPGGETLEEVGSRVAAACEELASESARGNVIVVSHVSPIKAAVTWALRSGPELSWRLSLGVASITRIATGGPVGPVLVSFNETTHLAGTRV